MMAAVFQSRIANRMFTMISYARSMMGSGTMVRKFFALMLLVGGLMWSPAAQAQNCAQATTQGTAPASWQTYCWLNLGNYNDTTARSTTGQNMTFTLPDGSVLSFNARVTGTAPAYNAVIAPSWGGAAVGNSAFIGIPGRPVLYSAQSGTSRIAISNITVSPPAGGGVTVYSFVVADAESSNDSEALRMSTNGGAWQLLDSVPPISGSVFPPIAGVGTSNVTVSGTPGTVGAYIIGSNSPTSVTVETQSGGLQGVMFAIRFATIRLQTQILGLRANAADQFQFQVASTATNAAISSGVTSGTTNGPFSTAPLSMSAGVPLTLRVVMAGGSVSTLPTYPASLSCVNTSGPTRSTLPNNLVTTNTSIGQLQFGESLLCTYTLGALPRLRVSKAMGTLRRFATDQFTTRIMNGTTVVASSTTTGSGNTVTAGDTNLVQVVTGQAYTVDEVAAGTTVLGNYTATMVCTNAAPGSTTALPSAVGGAITLSLGDAVTCVITNSRQATAALVIDKTSMVISDPVNGTTNPKLIPGAIVEYAITVRNAGTVAVEAGTLAILDVMPPNMAFAVGTPVTFTNGTPSSGLTAFNAATMVRFSSAAGGVAPYTYVPVGSFDPNVRGIRITPAGSLAGTTSATAQPNFTIRFRAQVQ